MDFLQNKSIDVMEVNSQSLIKDETNSTETDNDHYQENIVNQSRTLQRKEFVSPLPKK